MATGHIIPAKDSAALQQLESKLNELKQHIESISISSPETLIEAKRAELDVKNYIKAVELSDFARDAASKKEEYERAANIVKKLSAPGETLLKEAVQRRKVWENEERRKAEEEQRRINEERRIAAQKLADEERKERERQAEIERKHREKEIEKQRAAGEIRKREADQLKKEAAEAEERERKRAAEDAKKTAENVQTVTVKPNLPSVAGTVSRQNWKFRVIDPLRVSLAYQTPHEVRVGIRVRELKDKAKAEAEIGGIEVWAE